MAVLTFVNIFKMIIPFFREKLSFGMIYLLSLRRDRGITLFRRQNDNGTPDSTEGVLDVAF